MKPRQPSSFPNQFHVSAPGSSAAVADPGGRLEEGIGIGRWMTSSKHRSKTLSLRARTVGGKDGGSAPGHFVDKHVVAKIQVRTLGRDSRATPQGQERDACCNACHADQKERQPAAPVGRAHQTKHPRLLPHAAKL